MADRFTFGNVLGIGIILVLAAMILFPCFPHISETALATSCMSNLKVMGLGLIQYAQDNDDSFPSPSGTGPGMPSWRSAILPYTKSRDAFECPSRRSKEAGPDGFATSYAANDAGVFGHPAGFQGLGAFSPPGAKPLKTTDFIDPARLIAICEITGTASNDFDPDDPSRFGNNMGRLWAGHTGLTQVCLADAHAIRVPPRQTLSYVPPPPTIEPIELKEAYRAREKNGTEHARYAKAMSEQPTNLWYRDGSKPLTRQGAAMIADSEE